MSSRPFAVIARPLATLALACALSAADAPAPAPAPAAEATAAPALPQWQPIVHGLGGATWGPGGVSALALDPGTNALLAGVSGQGLWKSTDQGETWSALGAIPNTKGKPSCILFDPAKSGDFWVGIDSGSPGLFLTVDAGATFKHIPDADAVASFAVDLEDPKHKLMVAGLADRNHDVRISTTGGSVFSRTHFPADLGLCREVAIVGAKTVLVGAHGHDDRERTPTVEGIWLSADAGRTWGKVSDAAPCAHLVTLADGTLLWPCGEHETIQRSKDHGRSWNALSAAAQYAPTAVHGSWLAAIGGGKLMLSSDNGETWDAVGGPLPINPDGLLWDEHSHGFFIWHASDGREKDALMRLQAPDSFDTLTAPVLIRDLAGWDGTKAVGGGWPGKPEASLASQATESRHGHAALQWHVVTKTFFTNAGWVWGPYPLADGDAIDASAESKLILSLKLTRLSKDPDPAGLPTQIHVQPAYLSGGTATPSKQEVDLLKACPKLVDGKWHDVAIPLSDFGAADLKKLIGINLTANNGSNDFQFDLFIDDIGFAR